MPGKKVPETERREQILNAALEIAIARRLERLTIRDVGRRAGVSSGLILFHFHSRDGLLRALLDWMLRQNALLQLHARRPPANDCLGELIRDQCLWLANNRERTELFFDFWVAGTRDPLLRRGMRAALVRYRQAFRAVAASALAGRRGVKGAVSADAVAAAAVSFVHGCAMQVVIDPRHFQLHAALSIAAVLAGGAPGRTRAASGSRRPASRPARRRRPRRR